MKIVINKCYGGFGLSEAAFKWLIEKKNWTVTEFDSAGNYKDEKALICRHIGENYGDYSFVADKNEIRTNLDLIECIEVLGKISFGKFSQLGVIEIPDDVEWEIEEYDGIEWVSEKHRTWK